MPGPIVRVAPHEVHLSDPEHYDKIYTVRSKFSKDAQFYGGFANPNSMFTTPSNELHRARRGDLNPFFSRKVVFDHETMVQEKVNKLMGRIEEALDSDMGLDVHHGLRAVSIDVITDYAFGESYRLLDQPDLGLQFFTLVQRLGPAAWLFRQWPWVKPVVMMMPKKVVYFLSEPMGFVRDLQSHCKEQIDQLIEARSTVHVDKDREIEKSTIFTSLLPTTGNIDEATKTVVGDEAYTVLTAAADTTGNAMTTITHYVLSDPKIYKRLHAELKIAFSSNQVVLDYASLEKLPYLSCVIKEGLRLSFGVPGRLPRVVPDTATEFESYVLPPGVGASLEPHKLGLQANEKFPDEAGKSFCAFREGQQSLPRHEVSTAFIMAGGYAAVFDDRSSLAYCELYVTIGTLFRRFPNLQGNDLVGEELAYDDYFSSYTPLHARKLHVMAADPSKTG
ncbi:MAG: hypothetical protein Q9176_004216 [Flavoplaca citrina]